MVDWSTGLKSTWILWPNFPAHASLSLHPPLVWRCFGAGVHTNRILDTFSAPRVHFYRRVRLSHRARPATTHRGRRFCCHFENIRPSHFPGPLTSSSLSSSSPARTLGLGYSRAWSLRSCAQHTRYNTHAAQRPQIPFIPSFSKHMQIAGAKAKHAGSFGNPHRPPTNIFSSYLSFLETLLMVALCYFGWTGGL